MDAATVLLRLQAAQNAHDVDALVDCFHPDYTSEQPRHPDRAFRGANRVRENWTAMFEDLPGLTIELLRYTQALDGETVWSEWRWADPADGSDFEALGVIILGVRDDRIRWARLYMDEVDRSGARIDDAPVRPSGTD
jgi:ketosteroid isomerase-like protein